MHLITLAQQQLRQVGAILTGDAGNKSSFGHGQISLSGKIQGRPMA
jgi:hypothetical protein